MAIRVIRQLLRLRDVDADAIADGETLVWDAGTSKFVPGAGGGGGAPDTADYLVGTAQAGLSAEIVVGTTPGGELGGTWGSPTVDAVHSGSSHAAVQAAAEASAVILAPATSARNVIQPTGAAVLPLSVKGAASQSADLTQWQNSAGTVLARVDENGWVGAGVDPIAPVHAYRAVTASTAFDQFPAFFSDSELTSPAATPGIGMFMNLMRAKYVSILNPAAAADHLITLRLESRLAVTDGSSGGDGIDALALDTLAVTEAGNTQAVSTLTGFQMAVEHNSPHNMTLARGSFASVFLYGGIATQVATSQVGWDELTFAGTVPDWRLMYLGGPWLGSASSFITNLYGIDVAPAAYGGSTGTVTNFYGVRVRRATDPAVTGSNYAIYTDGGQVRLHAGTSTELPLVVKGAASQSANLMEAHNSSGTVLAAVGSGGWLEMLEQSVPSTPAANKFRMFARDSGGGKTQLVVVFESGNTVVVAEDF